MIFCGMTMKKLNTMWGGQAGIESTNSCAWHFNCSCNKKVNLLMKKLDVLQVYFIVINLKLKEQMMTSVQALEVVTGFESQFFHETK